MTFTINLFRFCILLYILALPACTFYNTLAINTEKEFIESNYRLGKIIVIHDNSEEHEFLLSDITIENDSLKGNIGFSPSGKKHPLHKRTFLKSSVEAYQPISTMHIYSSASDIKPGPFSIPISSIKTAEIHEKNVAASVGATVGVVAVSVVGATFVVLAIACSCPQVSSYDAKGTQFHGSLFPGSLLKSLKRDDYLILKHPLITDQGELKLRISNEMAETQYIDQLELLEVEHEGYANLALNNDNKLVAYNKPMAPEQVVVGSSNDISSLLAQQDDLSYDFNDISAVDKLNELTLKFDKSKFSDNPALLIHAQQTPWLDTVANFIFYQAGEFQSKWVKRKDNSSPVKLKNNSIKRGLSLNVYLKLNEAWEYVGTHHNVGTSGKRDLLLELELKNHESPFIEIKLESAFKIWEIDQVGLTDDWSKKLSIKSLDLQAANSHQGNDVAQRIHRTDEQYLIQKELDSYVDLHFEAPAISSASTIVLHGSGYYHKHSDFDDKKNLAFFAKFKKKLGLQDVSRALYQYKNIILTDPATASSSTVSRSSN